MNMEDFRFISLSLNKNSRLHEFSQNNDDIICGIYRSNTDPKKVVILFTSKSGKQVDKELIKKSEYFTKCCNWCRDNGYDNNNEVYFIEGVTFR